MLRAQAADQPWREPQVRLRIAYSGFVRSFGPINRARMPLPLAKQRISA